MRHVVPIISQYTKQEISSETKRQKTADRHKNEVTGHPNDALNTDTSLKEEEGTNHDENASIDSGGQVKKEAGIRVGGGATPCGKEEGEVWRHVLMVVSYYTVSYRNRFLPTTSLMRDIQE